MNKDELIADLRERAEVCLSKSCTDNQGHRRPMKERSYWIGYAHGLMFAAEHIELGLK